MSHSASEQILANHIHYLKLPKPQRQFRFYKKRKWLSDFAWPDEKLICEVEGGICDKEDKKGRHIRAKGFQGDCDKYNTATMLGYRVLRVTTQDVKSGKAINYLVEIFKDK